MNQEEAGGRAITTADVPTVAVPASPADVSHARPPEIAPQGGLGEALRAAWQKSGGWPGILAASAPTVVFVVAGAIGGLVPAVVAAAVTAAVACVAKVIRREGLAGALGGL